MKGLCQKCHTSNVEVTLDKDFGIGICKSCKR
jgi:hypothetical protein